MADIIKSRSKKSKVLLTDFKRIVEEVNLHEKDSLLSPLTITLGDEFQSVPKSLSGALQVIIRLEESIISNQIGFKLRYVLFEGPIDTPINTTVAYGMLGAGLTGARAALEAMKVSNNRFLTVLNDTDRSDALNKALYLFQHFVDSWKLSKDFYLVSEFLRLKDYKLIATNLKKDRSLIWKREKSLRMDQYAASKEVLYYLAK